MSGANEASAVEGRAGRSVELEAVALQGEARSRKHDHVVTEEPLELRLVVGAKTQTFAVTMRTPGNDFELAAGFVFSEGIVHSRDEIAGLTYCLDPSVEPEQRYNIVTVELRNPARTLDLARFERHFTMSSSCGVCGRAQLDSIRSLGVTPIEDDVRIAASVVYALPQRMREAQRIFEKTGGLHAAALFDERGDVVAVREDVGRHNALDKLVGWALLDGRLPLRRCALMVSGRASYEILQKSVMARIPIVCSVSAPSSLAVELAREFNVTLVGFVRDDRANVYTNSDRVD
ncbi:MAG: formate dehydrogenase accessory sulfurtransferase FdhD [Candidatus Eremiobacteraeota bacterium]|nr:formate dehydrogenase accessory sulfurtransferase FdhD [Candidatus Eremiobacteraeota bacterium]